MHPIQALCWVLVVAAASNVVAATSSCFCTFLPVQPIQGKPRAFATKHVLGEVLFTHLTHDAPFCRRWPWDLRFWLRWRWSHRSAALKQTTSLEQQSQYRLACMEGRFSCLSSWLLCTCCSGSDPPGSKWICPNHSSPEQPRSRGDHQRRRRKAHKLFHICHTV